jgi:hypothetical protein
MSLWRIKKFVKGPLVHAAVLGWVQGGVRRSCQGGPGYDPIKFSKVGIHNPAFVCTTKFKMCTFLLTKKSWCVYIYIYIF